MEESQKQLHDRMIDAVAQSLADVTISHFTSQLSAVDEATKIAFPSQDGIMVDCPV